MYLSTNDAGFSWGLAPISLIRSTLALHLALGSIVNEDRYSDSWCSILDTFIDLLVVVLLLHDDICCTSVSICT